VQEAKAKLSEVLRRAREEGPQLIGTQHPCVVVPLESWEEKSGAREPLGRWLVRTAPRGAARRGAGAAGATGYGPSDRVGGAGSPVTGWLLDTNVLSELIRAKPNPAVAASVERAVPAYGRGA
jgi:prevent-host-death family protein